MRSSVVAVLCALVYLEVEGATPIITGARVESCPSCSLNRLPQVKSFIYEDLPKYENVEFKRIHGAPPELVLFDDRNEEVQRLPLSKLSRDECNRLMEKYGFKANPDPPRMDL